MITVNDAVDLYMLEHRASGSSQKTLGNYTYRLRPLRESLGGQRLKVLTKQDLLVLVSDLRSKRYKHTTINCFVQAMKAFFNWCYLEGYTTVKLSEWIKRKKPRDIGNRAMLKSDFQKMLNACWRYRDYTLLMFQCDTAARTGEIITLTFDRLNLSDCEAVVNGKTGIGVVYFTPFVADILREYIDNHRPKSANHNYVFTNVVRPYGRLSNAHSLLQIYNHIAAKAGVTGRHNPHSIRHMVAQHFVSDSNMESARRKLRHEYIETTQGYVSSDEQYTRLVSDKHSFIKSLTDEMKEESDKIGVS